MATTGITIKLMIDAKSNKLIFAEASKDFVDFLFFILSLPIGTAIKLVTSESMVGSIGNIYTSVANLDKTYLQPDLHLNNLLLNPTIIASPSKIPLPSIPLAIRNVKFYTCYTHTCRIAISSEFNVDPCPSCFKKMCCEMKLLGSAPSESKGYVKEAVSYMISDDLSVTNMSAMSMVSVMNKFDISRLDLLTEKKVKVGVEEGVELLKKSFQSKTVLTDVFLEKKKGK